MLLSENGTKWENLSSPVENIIALGTLGKLFIATTEYGEIYVSPDGSNWMKQTYEWRYLLKAISTNGKSVLVAGEFIILSGTVSMVPVEGHEDEITGLEQKEFVEPSGETTTPEPTDGNGEEEYLNMAVGHTGGVVNFITEKYQEPYYYQIFYISTTNSRKGTVLQSGGFP